MMEEKDMIQEKIVEVRALIDSKKFVELSEYLEELHPLDIADILIESDEKYQQELFQILPLELAAKVLEEMDAETFISVLEHISEEDKRSVLEYMSSDDITDILGDMTEEQKDSIIKLLNQEDAENVKELLVYQEDTAGGLMTTDFVSLRKDMSIYQAIECLRENAPDAETIYYVYVVDKNMKLSGVISLRELIIAKPNKLIEEIMNENVIYVEINDDQEEVARIVKKYNLLAIPVTDSNMRMRGIITFDDVMDVIEEEATEDIYKFAGSSQRESENAEEESSLTRIISSVKARLPWLLITMFGGILSANILSRYTDTLNQYTAVAFFMPLLTGMGGNVGTQSSTLTVRGLATGYVDIRNSLKTIIQEMSIGATVGIICSLIVWLVAFLWMRDVKLGMVVGISMITNMLTAATIGTIVPIVFKKLGVDPAVASAPFISTTLDITGITIYFSLTTMLLLKIS